MENSVSVFGTRLLMFEHAAMVISVFEAFLHEYLDSYHRYLFWSLCCLI